MSLRSRVLQEPSEKGWGVFLLREIYGKRAPQAFSKAKPIKVRNGPSAGALRDGLLSLLGGAEHSSQTCRKIRLGSAPDLPIVVRSKKGARVSVVNYSSVTANVRMPSLAASC
jgi:hypothetical protein